MSRLNETKVRLESLGLQPEVLETCFALADLIAVTPAEQGRFLPLSFFSTGLGPGVAPIILTRALNLLSSMHEGPIELHGYIVSQGEVLPIPDDSFGTALGGGELVHPTSGEIIRDPLRRLHLYYSISAGTRDE